MIEPHVKLPVYNTFQLHVGLDNGHYNAELYGNNLGNSKGITDYANSGGANQTGSGVVDSAAHHRHPGGLQILAAAMLRRMVMRSPAAALVLLLGVGCVNFDAARAEDAAGANAVDIHWGVRIPLRDGVGLNATVYRPKLQSAPVPCIFTLTPYIGDSYHDRAMYFAGARLALPARGCARPRQLRGHIHAVCPGDQRRLRRRGVAGEAALLQRQGVDVGRILCRLRPVGNRKESPTAFGDHRPRRRGFPRRGFSGAQQHLLSISACSG